MPQHSYSQRTSDGYVNPAQLYSSMPVVYDDGMSYGNGDLDNELPIRPMFNTNIFDSDAFSRDWKKTYNDYSAPTTWKAPSRASTATTRDDASSTTGSTPASPSSSAPQQTQNNKRRAQNRAAQRAYRDRKTRYQLDLQQGINDIEDNIRRLQNENTELIRQLCEMRAANNDIRDIMQSGAASKRKQPTNRAEEALSSTSFSTPPTGELEGLYEPFAAMWNLIQMDPSVVQGTVTAQTILERLRGMAQSPETSQRMAGSSSESGGSRWT